MEKTVAAHHRCVKDSWPGCEPPTADQAPDPRQAAAQATAAHAEGRTRVVRTRQR
ncbi:MAG: ISL3 family transposase, partial [Longispora sp.]|nr:ISL3 family transposase [Longispora sp. (in: high G+C Gram-positive bacteria)]